MMRLFLIISVSLLTTLGGFGQNTRLVFDQYYVDKTNFNGDYQSFYDLNSIKNDHNGHLATETFVRYHANGQMAEIGQIINQNPEGIWKKWDENGQLIARLRYKEGQKIGKFVTWDSSGKVISRGYYDHKGKRKGTWKWRGNPKQKIQKKSFNP